MIGIYGIWCRSVRDLPVPAFIPNCEVASEMSGSDVFHPVIRWSVVLQRYFNNRSCMVVAFLVWCGPLFL